MAKKEKRNLRRPERKEKKDGRFVFWVQEGVV